MYCGHARVTVRGGVLNITATAWTAGFQWWRSGDITRTQNVSEYMLVLALCLVVLCKTVTNTASIVTHYDHGEDQFHFCP